MEENPEIKCFIYTCFERNSVFKKGFNPVGFSSNSKKEAPIGVPGTSKRSVPTLTGEGINTNLVSHDEKQHEGINTHKIMKINYFFPVAGWVAGNI